MRTLHTIALYVAAAGMLPGLAGCGIARGLAAYAGLAVAREEPEALAARLRPHLDLRVPEGSGPFPVALLLPGCVGTQPFERRWAARLREQGIATVVVDSFTTRGIDTPAELDAVCEGERLFGFERAGDVFAAADEIRSRPNLDADRIALLGWSHGGWAVMDALAFEAKGLAPPFLARRPEHGLAGVRAAAAFYPYCGFGSHARRWGWPAQARSLVFLASRDQNIPPAACREAVEELRARGAPIELVSFDADHWFDNPGGFDLVPHAFDAAATAAAEERILSLLADRLGPVR